MTDLIDLAYELGDLIDSMPEFDADTIYYTWEEKGKEYKRCFDWHTGNWFESSDWFEGSNGVPLNIIGKITYPEAIKLKTKMTEIVEANNDD